MPFLWLVPWCFSVPCSPESNYYNQITIIKNTLEVTDYFVTLTATGLAQLVEYMTVEQEITGSIPRAGPILRVLK